MSEQLYRIDPMHVQPDDERFTPSVVASLVEDGVLIPVKRCEHGKIDRHQAYIKDDDGEQSYHPNGVAKWKWCPGAAVKGET